MIEAERQIETLCRGVVDLHVRAELEERIASGKPLRVKAGFDPTKPDLHLGHTVLMQKMRQFQDLGHQVIFIIGDFTAMVGDPTGRNELRPSLTREDVMAAAATYQAQAFKILDRDRTIVRYNSEWLGKMGPWELIELGAKYTVARMLERKDFAARFEQGTPIFVHEFLYPLLQAYDSVAIEADIELGGTDQLFNLLVGRDIMPRYGKRGQMVMTTPILEGTDARVENGRVVGPKMSKSAGNYVGIQEPPLDMLNKLMLVDDGVIWRYMELLSSRSNEELAALRADVEQGRRSVVSVKELFAIEIVTRYHSAELADEALQKRREIASGHFPADAPTVEVTAEGDAFWLDKALAVAKLVASRSEGANQIKGGSVQVDGQVVKDDKTKLARGRTYEIQVGSKKRKFARVVVK